MHAADIELIKGQFFGGIQTAQRVLETALKLAEASTDPKVNALLPDIRKHLGMLGEITERFGRIRRCPFGGGPFGPAFLDDLDFEDDDDYDDEYDDESTTMTTGPSSGVFPDPGPAPKRAPSKRKKKKKK